MSALLPYSEYKESGVEWIGQIPAHWQASRTKFVAQLYSGHTPSRDKPEYWMPEECTIPWFTLADVWQLRDGTRTYLGDTSEKISPIGLANSAARLLPGGTVIVSRTASVGFAGIMPRPMATTQDFVNWVCSDRIRPRFLLHVFRAMRGEFSRLTMGSTHQTIYMPDVRSFSTPLPPLEEQEEIIAFLDRETARIDGLIAKKRRLIELLREKRQAVISHAVTKGLDPNAPMKDSDIEWLGQIPGHWEMKRLKHISPSQTVGVVVNPSTFVADRGPAFIYGSDVREGWIAADQARRISPEGNQQNRKSILRPGDLVTVRVGYPGLTAVVPESLDGANCASIMITRRSAKFVSEWLAYAFNSRLGRHQVQRVQYGAAQEQFNISHAVEFCFPVPPRSDQQAIVDYLDKRTENLEHSISLAEKIIAKLDEHRAALIAAAVTGKIDVRAQPSDEVEAAD